VDFPFLDLCLERARDADVLVGRAGNLEQLGAAGGSLLVQLALLDLVADRRVPRRVAELQDAAVASSTKRPTPTTPWYHSGSLIGFFALAVSASRAIWPQLFSSASKLTGTPSYSRTVLVPRSPSIALPN
jgi:hypothetical protein